MGQAQRAEGLALRQVHGWPQVSAGKQREDPVQRTSGAVGVFARKGENIISGFSKLT